MKFCSLHSIKKKYYSQRPPSPPPPPQAKVYGKLYMYNYHLIKYTSYFKWTLRFLSCLLQQSIIKFTTACYSKFTFPSSPVQRRSLLGIVSSTVYPQKLNCDCLWATFFIRKSRYKLHEQFRVVLKIK